MRIAGYLRVSTTEQARADVNSLDTQRKAIEDWARLHHPGSFVCLYADVESGRTAQRDALQLLLEDVQHGRIECVVVYMLDRWMRNMEEALRTLRVLEEHKVAFVSISEQIDTSSVAGAFLRDMLLRVAQLFSEIHAQRIRDKIRSEAKAGRWITGIPPFGYYLKDKRLHPHPEFAPIVRRAFEVFRNTQSIGEVRRFLNREVGDRRDRWRRLAQFTTHSVMRMLRSPFYLGKIVYNGEVLCEQAHLPIVDEELWQEVQTLLNHPRRVYSYNSRYRQYPLQGLMFCMYCGRSMSPYWVRNQHGLYFYYRCGSRLHGLRCVGGNVNADAIENAVVQAVAEVGRDPVLLAAVVGMLSETNGLAELERKIQEEEQAIQRLVQAIEIGGEIEMLVERLQLHRRKLAQLQAQQELYKIEGAGMSVEELRHLMSELPVLWQLASCEERKSMVHAVIDRVVVDTVHRKAEVYVRTVRRGVSESSPRIIMF